MNTLPKAMKVQENTFTTAIKRLQNDLGSFIKYCEKTKPEEWYLHKVRNKGNTRNCLYGHLVNWYYGKDWDGNITPIWDAFEEVGSTYYIYPINDGQNPKYPQKTARERCIAYLKNIESGDELWTWEAMDKAVKEMKAPESLKSESAHANTKVKSKLAQGRE